MIGVADTMIKANISSPEELRTIDHRAVYAWERQLREVEGKEASTVRRKSERAVLFALLPSRVTRSAKCAVEKAW